MRTSRVASTSLFPDQFEFSMEFIKKHLIPISISLFTVIAISISISIEIKVVNQHSILNEAFIEALESSSKSFRCCNLVVHDDNNCSQIGEISKRLRNLSVQIIKPNFTSARNNRIKILEKSVTSFLFRSKFDLISFDGRWEFFLSHTEGRQQRFLLLFDFQIEFSYLTKIFNAFKSLECSNINIITSHNDGKIVMYSCIPFSMNGECRSTSPVIVNVYNASQHQWNNLEIFPARFKNFYGCPVSYSMPIYPPATMKIKNHGNTSRNVDDYNGSDIEVIKGLSSVMNFSADIKFVAAPYDFGQIDSIRNVSSGAISHVYGKEADIANGFFFLSYERHKVLSYVYP